MTDHLSTIRQALERWTECRYTACQECGARRGSALAACDALEAERLTPEQADIVVTAVRVAQRESAFRSWSGSPMTDPLSIIRQKAEGIQAETVTSSCVCCGAAYRAAIHVLAACDALEAERRELQTAVEQERYFREQEAERFEAERLTPEEARAVLDAHTARPSAFFLQPRAWVQFSAKLERIAGDTGFGKAVKLGEPGSEVGADGR